MEVIKRDPAESSASFAHHPRDGIDWQRLPSALDNQRVCRVSEVVARIDQGSVEVEDDQAQSGNRVIG